MINGRIQEKSNKNGRDEMKRRKQKKDFRGSDIGACVRTLQGLLFEVVLCH